MPKKQTLKKQIYLILHDIRSAWNVGSMFRTADGAGIDKIYLTGYTATPEHPKVLKTSLGAEGFVLWERYKPLGKLIKKLQKDGIQVLALEQHPKSKNIFKYKPKYPIALVVGNEIRGVVKTTLAKVDDILEIPMHGQKENLNVAVAAGIALYAIRKKK
ncbi:MAG: TrmH family RNA methyltransferase [Parcubacteria group bacterium]